MIQLIKNNIDLLFCESLFMSVLLVSFMEYVEINLRVILLVVSISLAIIRIYQAIKKKKDE